MISSVFVLVIMAVFASVFPPSVFAQPQRTEVVEQVSGEACQPTMLRISAVEPLAQGGCCSNAGGFCGCSQGKVRCCNGTIAIGQCSCRSDGPWSVTSGPSDLDSQHQH